MIPYLFENKIESPYFAIPGIVTGNRPDGRMAPRIAFAAAVSDGITGLNVAR